VIGTHGHEGHLRIRPLTDNPQRFEPGRTLYMEGKRYRVLEARRAGKELLVQLDGVDTLTAALAMVRKPLEVPQVDVPPPAEGTYYHFQLLDLKVHDEDGTYLGRLSEVIITGANDVYVVLQESQELLIPAIADVILNVDLDAKRMTVALYPGLEPRFFAPAKQAQLRRRHTRHS
jgi:16S rRNA processing protein RimM